MILILGGTGMLGHKLFQHFMLRFRGTLCTMHRRASDSPYNRIAIFQSLQAIEEIDVLDFNRLSHLLLRLKPDFIVNCIGVIKQRYEASSYISAVTVNSLLPHQLAELCAKWGGRLIHFSTDCVFSGHQGMYKEGDLSEMIRSHTRIYRLTISSYASALV